MILNLLPTMTILTIKSINTSVLIIHKKLVALPIRTLFQKVIIRLFGFPSEILPIMTILTLTSIMLKLIKGTKYSFKMKDIEIIILL